LLSGGHHWNLKRGRRSGFNNGKELGENMPASSSGGSTIYPIGQVIPNSAQTILSIEFQGKAAGDTIYTVPAGKTFYILGFIIAAGGLCGIRCTSGGIVGNTAATGTFGASASVPIMYAVAGSTVNVAPYVNGNNGSVWGFLQ